MELVLESIICSDGRAMVHFVTDGMLQKASAAALEVPSIIRYAKRIKSLQLHR